MPSQQESCSNCKYFLPLDLNSESGKGLCRINPPKGEGLVRTGQVKHASDDGRWPLCLSNEWCGKWTRG